MVQVQTADSIFERMLGDIDYSDNSFAVKLYPFKVRVGCVKRRPPRHEFFQFILDMGLGDIERVLTGKPFRSKKLTFVFPERWLGVGEQYAFMNILAKHPYAKELEQVDIITASAVFISNFDREQIRILTWDDDACYECE